MHKQRLAVALVLLLLSCLFTVARGETKPASPSLLAVEGIRLDAPFASERLHYTSDHESDELSLRVRASAELRFAASGDAKLVSQDKGQAAFGLREGGLDNRIVITVTQPGGTASRTYTFVIYRPVDKRHADTHGPKLIGEYKEGKVHHHSKTWDQTYPLPDGSQVRLRWQAHTGKLLSNRSHDGGKTWSADFLEIDNFRKADKGNYIEIFQVSDGSFIVFQYVPQAVYKKSFGRDARFRKVSEFSHYCVDLLETRAGGKPRLLIPRNLHGGKGVFSVSDDLGDTWREVALPQAPREAGDLVEANLIEPLNGRLWVTYRSQVGQAMYQTFSRDHGETWAPISRARFATGRTWQRSYRVPEGPHKDSLVFLWANMRQSAPEDRTFYHPGREALHMAISHDDGKTWHGFRQVNAYAFRYGEQPTRLDRGATDQEIECIDGKFHVYSGNGNHYTKLGRHVSNPYFKQREIEVDLDWLMRNFAREKFTGKGIDNDFENGELSQWLVFKRVGAIKGQGHDRTRIAGPRLIRDGERQVLQVRRTLRKFDGLVEPPDVATWNVPNGRRGVLTTFIKLSDTFRGGRIRLNDQLYFNSDGYYSKTSIMTPQFSLEIAPDGKLAGPGMQSAIGLKGGAWHKLQLAWSLDHKRCAVHLDGRRIGRLNMEHPTPNGVSYIRFESTADRIIEDRDGFFIRSAEVRVGPPSSP